MTLFTLNSLLNNDNHKKSNSMLPERTSSPSQSTKFRLLIDGNTPDCAAAVNQAPVLFATSKQAGPTSDARSTNDQTTRRCYPTFFSSEEIYHLPPIQHLFMNNDVPRRMESPSPLFDSNYNFFTSPVSSIASSPSPIDDDTEDTDDNCSTGNDKVNKQQMLVSVRRKGSIASILNSDPELKLLDAEEHKFGYQSFFFDKHNKLSSRQQQLNVIKKPVKHGRSSLDCSKTIQYNRGRYLALKRQRTAIHHADDTELSFTDRPMDSRVLPAVPHLFDYQQRDLKDCLHACQSNNFNTEKAQPTMAAVELNRVTALTTDNTRSTKGLRHFSKQVYDKVAEKGITTYNEVANELALEMQKNSNSENCLHDQKNIRRRVYDALNVLMAMKIIAKDKKVIRWLGMPLYLDELQDDDASDEEEKRFLLEQIQKEKLREKRLASSIKKLRATVNSKIKKHSKLRNLVERNYTVRKHASNQSEKVQLPFFMVLCSTENTDDIEIRSTSDARSAVIASSVNIQNNDIGPISVYEDTEVLNALLSRDSAATNTANAATVVSSKSSIYSLLETPIATYSH